jgi:hypothetical protein
MDAGRPYFEACSAETDGGDGQCLPFALAFGGHCFENGPAALGQACYPTRSDAGPFCAAGGFCFSGQTTALCLPLCTEGAYDAGPGPCPSGSDCLIGFLRDQNWGVCVADCGSTNCPRGMGCTMLPDGGRSVCLPE